MRHGWEGAVAVRKRGGGQAGGDWWVYASRGASHMWVMGGVVVGGGGVHCDRKRRYTLLRGVTSRAAAAMARALTVPPPTGLHFSGSRGASHFTLTTHAHFKHCAYSRSSRSLTKRLTFSVKASTWLFQCCRRSKAGATAGIILSLQKNFGASHRGCKQRMVQYKPLLRHQLDNVLIIPQKQATFCNLRTQQWHR